MNDRDPTDIRGEEREHANQRRRAKLAANLEADDFKWIMSNKRGRRFVWRLLDKAGVYRSSFTGNSETFFREGQRNLGLQILGLIHAHTPELYHTMLKEQTDHDRDERTTDP